MVPQKGPKLSEPRAIATEVASYRAMTDTFERLKAVLADRYDMEHEHGTGRVVLAPQVTIAARAAGPVASASAVAG